MMKNLEEYKSIMKFLSLYLGHDFELILSDTEQILHIENSFDNSLQAGSPLRDMQKELIHNPDCQSIPYTINYRDMTQSKEKLRSATYFIRDNEELIGLLTINMKVTSLLSMRDTLENLINGCGSHNRTSNSVDSQKPAVYYESLSQSSTDLIDAVMEEACRRFKATPDRFTTEEKLSTVREMDKRGIFLVKGSVSEVAKKLNSADVTIYRYLHQINKQ